MKPPQNTTYNKPQEEVNKKIEPNTCALRDRVFLLFKCKRFYNKIARRVRFIVM